MYLIAPILCGLALFVCHVEVSILLQFSYRFTQLWFLHAFLCISNVTLKSK